MIATNTLRLFSDTFFKLKVRKLFFILTGSQCKSCTHWLTEVNFRVPWMERP